MFERLVLAVDNVEEMKDPVRVALDLVERYDAECLPIHVIDLPQNPSFPEYYERETGKVDWEDVLDEIEMRGGEIVEDICDGIEDMAEKQGRDVDCTCRIGVGDPADTIVRFGEDVDADIIVMGVHGRKGLDRILHGSVSETVVRESDVPVLTVHV